MNDRIPMRSIYYHLVYLAGLYRVNRLTWHDNKPLAQLERWSQAGLLKGQRALDVGCGAGTHALWLAEQGFCVVAADFNRAALRQVERQARVRRLDIQTLLLDVTRPSPPLPPFDLVVDRECLQDLRTQSMCEQYARNLRQWMSPGGAYILSAWLRRPGAPPPLRPSIPEEVLEGLFPDLLLEERELEPPHGPEDKLLHAVYRFRASTARTATSTPAR